MTTELDTYKFYIDTLRAQSTLLERNWILQGILSIFAIIYLKHQDFSTAITGWLKIPEPLLPFAIPVVLTFLFVRFGYFLYAYLVLRRGFLTLHTK